MFEAKLKQAGLLKRLLESIKDLVTHANFDCSPTGIALQAMDESRVSLVALLLRQEGFESYRCDRALPLGINLESMAKILKCAANDDSVTMKADDNGDSITFTFESTSGDKVSDFELKLMDIDGDSLAIPEAEYNAVVSMPSNEFQRVCRDLSVIGDTVMIEASKGGIRFAVSGDLGTGNIQLKQNSAVDSKSDEGVSINTSEPVALNFAVRYLNHFTKATGLSSTVSLSMSPDSPVVVEYPIEELGYVRYYLAPKIDEDE